jgi:hypothetical protein
MISVTVLARLTAILDCIKLWSDNRIARMDGINHPKSCLPFELTAAAFQIIA